LKITTWEARQHIKDLSSPSVPKKRGRPRLISAEEEAGLVAYVVWLERSGFPAEKSQVEEAAREFRLSRGLSDDLPGRGWYPRFRQRHEELKKSKVKPVEKARKSFENHDVEDVKTFFSSLKEVHEEFDIGPSESWNEDECGIRVGCLGDQVEVLIVRTTRSQRPEINDPNNRETCTLLGAGNAVGDSIPPWLIFKAFPTESWADIDCVPGMRFAKSETGFSNREISFEWLHTFNAWSWKCSAKAKKSGYSLSEWFGCDEWLRDAEKPYYLHKHPPNSRPHEERIYRLLIIDGFAGHLSFEFVSYCIMFDIVFCTLPPHSTHILQPLDVGVFQALKAAHQKLLRRSIREGNLAYSRTAFAEAFKEIYTRGFSAHNIISGFEKSGIYPPTEEPALKKIMAKRLRNRQPVEAVHADLLPKEGRFQQAEDALNDVIERYRDVMSSPSREALQSARKVLSESTLMDKQRNAFVSNFESRLKSVTTKRKPGKFIKPTGFFATSVNYEDIKAQHEAEVAADEEKQQRKQLRSMRSILKQEIGRLQDEWRAEKIARFGTTKKKYPFRQWLEESGKDRDFLALEVNHKQFNQILNVKPDGFMIDVPDSQEVRQAKREASRAARPILAMEWPNSDDTVRFTGFGPFNDDDDEAIPPQDEDDTQIEPLPRYMRSSPPIEPDTPCPAPSQSQAPPHTAPLRRWKEIEASIRDWKVERASQAGPSGQSHS
jgi:hypothetical protein